MKKNWLLLITVTLFISIVALGTVRWMAPQLLGIPIDLQAVQVSEKLPPFFEGVFGKGEATEDAFLLKDPFTRVRGKPFYYLHDEIGGPNAIGPHDLLGFRNRHIPTIADVVIIGDSQTYGNNASIDFNWPSYFRTGATKLLHSETEIYSMAVGGWSAPQYLQMFNKALAFQPQIIIIAFYTGNDPREAVSLIYSSDRWKSFQSPNDNIDDKPPSPGFPPPPEEQKTVRFSDNIVTTFTPSLRLISNDNKYGVVKAGYRILGETGKRINNIITEKYSDSPKSAPKVIFTIIPTKELVYAKKIERDNLKVSEDYDKLVKMEKENIILLSDSFNKLKNIEYIDLLHPLQTAALAPVELYPANENGHPVPEGYRIIAHAALKGTVNDLAMTQKGINEYRPSASRKEYYLFNGRSFAQFASPLIAYKNGWSEKMDIPVITSRELEKYPLIGVIDQIRPDMFGPPQSKTHTDQSVN